MKWTIRCVAAFTAVVSMVLGSPARATPFLFTIDNSQSSLNISVYIGGSPDDGGTLITSPQTPGSDTTTISGTINVDVTSGSLQFLTTGDTNYDLQSVDQAPLPGGDPGTAPAQYGLNIAVGTLETGVGAVRGMVTDATSDPIGLASGTFDASQVMLSISTGGLDYNLTGFSPASGNADLTGNSGTNAATGGLYTSDGSTATLTLPVYVDVPVTVMVGTLALPLDAILQGQIVATAAVPEPTTLSLLALGLLGLVGWARSRSRK